MNNLFEDFNYEKVLMQTGDLDYFRNLSPVYLNQCYEVSQRRGKFTYICARCFKPIKNYKNLIEDKHSHLLYGRGCYASIYRRQSNLVYSWVRGVLDYQTQEELQVFECTSCNRKFTALLKNILPHCGINPRCCFCCVYNTLRYKGIQCPFEQAFGIQYKLGREC